MQFKSPKQKKFVMAKERKSGKSRSSKSPKAPPAHGYNRGSAQAAVNSYFKKGRGSQSMC